MKISNCTLSTSKSIGNRMRRIWTRCIVHMCRFKHSDEVKIKWNNKTIQANQSQIKTCSLSLSISLFFRSAFPVFFLSLDPPFDGKLIENFYIRNGHYTEVYDVLVDHHRRVLLMNLVIVSLRLPWNRYGRIIKTRIIETKLQPMNKQNAFLWYTHPHTQFYT